MKRWLLPTVALIVIIGASYSVIQAQVATTQGAPKAPLQFTADALVGGWLNTNADGVSSVIILRADGSWTNIEFKGTIDTLKSPAVRGRGEKWEVVSRPRATWSTPQRNSPIIQAADAGEPGAGWMMKFYPSDAHAWEEFILRSTEKELVLTEAGPSAFSTTQYKRLSADELASAEKAIPSPTPPSP